MSFWTYIIDNFNYYLVVIVTLFLYDLVDLYIELKEFGNFSFLRRKEFWVYYVVVAFFSIGSLEAGYILGLFAIDSKYIVSFVIPLVFAIILENLVVKIGGVDNSIDIAQFFDRFKYAIKESLIRKEDLTKVQSQTELLNSSVKTEKILDWCRFYSSEEDLQKLAEKTAGLNDKGKRIVTIKYLVNKAKSTDIAVMLCKEALKAEKETENK